MEQEISEGSPLIRQQNQAKTAKTVKIFMVTALVEVVCQVGIFAYDLSQYSPRTIPNAFAYLTVWQLSLLALTSIIALGQILRIYWAKKGEAAADRNSAIIQLKKEPSGWRNLSFCFSILTTVLFWSILSGTSDNLGLSFVFHGLGMLISFAVICLNRLNFAKGTLPARCESSENEREENTSQEIKPATDVKGLLQNCHYTRNFSFAFTFALFSVGYTMGGLTNTNGEHYIYNVLDWNNNPGTAAMYIGVGLVAIIAITFLSGWLEKFSQRIHDKCFEDKSVAAIVFK